MPEELLRSASTIEARFGPPIIMSEHLEVASLFRLPTGTALEQELQHQSRFVSRPAL